MQSFHTTGMLQLLPYTSKISFSANISTKVTLLTLYQFYLTENMGTNTSTLKH